VEVLKGTSGLQAGTSAPGGLVNYAVKRPLMRDHAEARLQWSGRNTLLGAADVGGRFGADGNFGWRLNAAAEQLRPELRNADGDRRLVAAAGEWRFRNVALLEVEAEWSRRAQSSQQAFSLLGDRLPAVPDPRLNLNNQPWSLPTVFEGQTGSLRFTHLLWGGWRGVLHAGTQRLRTDDRLAFAYGKFDPITFDCSPCDRFAADGTFSVWDYRSENERRRTNALQAELMGRAVTGSIRHDLRLGVLQSTQRIDLQAQAYNLVGVGNVLGTAVLPADPTLFDPNTNRDERTRELFVQDRVVLNERWTAWLGLRHTAFERRSIRTNGSRATSYDDSLTTPWVAFSVRLAPEVMAFASRGEGAESQVVPNRPSQYTNAGQGLPVLKSVQEEVGVRGGPAVLNGRGFQWQATAFRITRPTSNLDACANLGLSPCTGRMDGDVRHQGLEASVQWASAPWFVGLQATLLDAQRRGSTAQPELNGKAPTNVPEQIIRARARWTPVAVPGLALQGTLSHEGSRQILPDNTKQLPGWTRADAVMTWEAPGSRAQWLLGVDNLTDRRYWREAPFQFGHAYLYPGAVRTVRAGVLIRM
jgi:iron complex outermembrane receptor protein